MRTKTAILSILSLFLLAGTASAFTATHNFPAEIVMQSKETRELCNITLNTSNENESVSNFNLFFAGAPINVTYTPLPAILTNQSYNFCLNFSVPQYIPKNSYLNSIIVSSNTTPIYLTYNITIQESMNWSVMTEPFNATINTGSSQVIPISIQNNGNSIFELVTTINGNASNISSISTNVMSYPMLNSGLSLQFNVPKSYPIGDYYGDILISTKNAPPEATKHLNYTLKIYDQLPPILYSISVPDVMATKPTTLTITADDNLGIKDVVANISHNETSSEQYPVIVNTTTNETVWQTRYFNKTIVDATDLNLQNQINTNLYQGNFERTDVITYYLVDIATTDKSNNTITNHTTFEVKPLNVMLNYTPFATLKALKKPYGFIYESDYGTPLTFTLKNVTYRGNYTFEIYDVGGNLRGMLNVVGQSVTLQDTGQHFLKMIGDAASDRRGENTDGYFSAIFGWSTIQQHVPISDLVVSGTVINYTLSMPFNGTVDTQKAQCTPYDTGDFATSYVQCIMQFPPEVGPDDMIWPVTIKERTDAEMLKKQMNDRINSMQFQMTLLFLGVISFIILSVVYARIIRPYVLENAG